ncbi:MAG: four helix bundle protein [Chloroflexi bacterium]|nr:four helix bundle protein [Chloroflexota bacterium]
MTPEELKKRTKAFAINAIRLGDALPNTRSGNIVANQFIRSATSVGANYRAACRARSDADFASKIGITLEESDESVYWMEIITESGMKPAQQIAPLLKEGNELVAIFVASSNTVRNRLGKNSKSK